MDLLFKDLGVALFIVPPFNRKTQNINLLSVVVFDIEGV